MNKLINDLNVTDAVNNTSISVKSAARIIQDKLYIHDQRQFSQDLFNDTNNVNGNKLRTYRTYKSSVGLKLEPYVTCQLPRAVRRTMTLFRSGALPLAVETGRYSRPQVQLCDRLCKFCELNAIENEMHFLMTCPLYTDIRYELFEKASDLIDGFNLLCIDDKFISIMNCENIQYSLAHTLHKFFQRRKRFL